MQSVEQLSQRMAHLGVSPALTSRPSAHSLRIPGQHAATHSRMDASGIPLHQSVRFMLPPPRVVHPVFAQGDAAGVYQGTHPTHVSLQVHTGHKDLASGRHVQRAQHQNTDIHNPGQVHLHAPPQVRGRKPAAVQEMRRAPAEYGRPVQWHSGESTPRAQADTIHVHAPRTEPAATRFVHATDAHHRRVEPLHAHHRTAHQDRSTSHGRHPRGHHAHSTHGPRVVNHGHPRRRHAVTDPGHPGHLHRGPIIFAGCGHPVQAARMPSSAVVR